MLQLQFLNIVAVWTNHQFLAEARVGTALEDLTATVNAVFIPPDAVTRLKKNSKSHSIKSG
jgi:hypothetical protein